MCLKISAQEANDKFLKNINEFSFVRFCRKSFVISLSVMPSDARVVRNLLLKTFGVFIVKSFKIYLQFVVYDLCLFSLKGCANCLSFSQSAPWKFNFHTFSRLESRHLNAMLFTQYGKRAKFAASSCSTGEIYDLFEMFFLCEIEFAQIEMKFYLKSLNFFLSHLQCFILRAKHVRCEACEAGKRMRRRGKSIKNLLSLWFMLMLILSLAKTL